MAAGGDQRPRADNGWCVPPDSLAEAIPAHGRRRWRFAGRARDTHAVESDGGQNVGQGA